MRLDYKEMWRIVFDGGVDNILIAASGFDDAIEKVRKIPIYRYIKICRVAVEGKIAIPRD